MTAPSVPRTPLLGLGGCLRVAGILRLGTLSFRASGAASYRALVSGESLLVTRRLPEVVLARARRSYRARENESDVRFTADQLVARAEGCDAILCAPGDALGGDAVDRLPDSVRAIATYSVGFDHVDVRAAARRGIPVFHTPGVLTDATADLTLLLLLGATRRAWEGQSLLRSGEWRGWTPTQLVGVGLAGRRLAILGMGRIGAAVAARARTFGMRIHYCNRHRLPADAERDAVYHADPEALLAEADVLSLHCPSTPATRGFLDGGRIEQLPPGAIVINTARGEIVDDEALIDALASGRVAAAGLDVYAGEPDVHPGYLSLPNAFLLPHMGSSTEEARRAMGDKALDNLDAFFAGETPPDRVEV